mmetsp:Transcript_80524/g.240008  ORF Transcript_80524/g.240008 Transcript_80524/m.240008 type:complete len:237 (+) Transcript_80524:326-1036(+)
MATMPGGICRPSQAEAGSSAWRTIRGAAGHIRRTSRTHADSSGRAAGAEILASGPITGVELKISARTASCNSWSHARCHSSRARDVAVVSCPAPRICMALSITAPSGRSVSRRRSTMHLRAPRSCDAPADSEACRRARSMGRSNLCSRSAEERSSAEALRRRTIHQVFGTPASCSSDMVVAAYISQISRRMSPLKLSSSPKASRDTTSSVASRMSGCASNLLDPAPTQRSANSSAT